MGYPAGLAGCHARDRALTAQNDSSVGRLTPAMRAELVLLAAAALVMAAFVLLRYGGLWGENDTATFARSIRSVLETNRLAAAPGWGVYTNGYGYPALVAFLMGASGLSLAEIQIFVKPLLTVWVVVPAWLAYRELTTSGRVATLATAILLTQPEVLFVILRGTHETFTRGLMLLLLFLLLRSLDPHKSAGRFAATIVAIPIIGYALITSNNLMALSFTVAIGLALGLIWTLGRIRPRLAADRQVLRRMGLLTLVLVILSFVFLFYVYRPALSGFLLLETIWDQASAMVSGGAETINPYGTVTAQWIHPGAYLLLSLANWVLLAGSGLIWLWQSWRWLFRSDTPSSSAELLLWGLYGAFALQGFVSVVADFSGALAGNLQQRIFPSFVLAAAPLVARFLSSWRPRQPRRRKVAHRTLYVGMAVVALFSVLKATNDPLLSNKWLFYRPAEMQAVEWARTALPHREIWLEQDERLFSAARLLHNGEVLGFAEDDATPLSGTPNFLITTVTVSRSQRMGLTLPVTADDLITYDNGEAQMYHRRPTTPYQP